MVKSEKFEHLHLVYNFAVSLTQLARFISLLKIEEAL